MGYFNELPNIEINNRTKNELSNDEVTIVKNLFKRAKIRDDLSSVVSAFDYYSIEGNERPEQVAERFYDDPELDWVILLTNNILNIQDEWPLDENSFNKFLIDKYGEEEAFTGIHHYETNKVVDAYNRLILPENLIVDEAFYNAPEYEPISVNPPGITFPPIKLPGVQANLLPIIGLGNSIAGIYIEESGEGYTSTPNVFLSTPPVTADSSAEVVINNFNVTTFVNIDGGQGYNSTPNVSIEEPPVSIQATASCSLGSGANDGVVVSITNLNPGIGYGLTAPTIDFTFPSQVFSRANYVTNSSILVGDGLEGMYVREDGRKIYTSSLFSGNMIREFDLSSAWDITTLSFNDGLDLSSEFSYTTGVELSPDGQYLYVSGALGLNYKLIQYTLSTPWDITTATLTNGIPTTQPGGVRFKSDGTVFYFLDLSFPDKILQYPLSTPWDISTRTSSSGELDVTAATGDNGLVGFTLFEDGSKLFAVGTDLTTVMEFDLSTPWDITTASFTLNYYIGDKMTQPCDVYVRSDRKDVLIAGNISGNTNKIHQYRLTSVAEAVATVSKSSINGINITNGGVGYDSAPTLTISAPYPSVRAVGVCSITAVTGIVTDLVITNPGFGYTEAPTVTIDPAPISRNAVFKVFMNQNTGISSVIIYDGGSNYVNFPFFTIDAPEELTNVEINETYSQNNKTWRWNGTSWEEKITDELQYFDPVGSSIVKVIGRECSFPVTNYEYEARINDSKRQILLLKPSFLPLIITDLRNSMKYDRKSKYYISDTLKSTYNPNLSGV